jgi:hypothetical protein
MYKNHARRPSLPLPRIVSNFAVHCDLLLLLLLLLLFWGNMMQRWLAVLQRFKTARR